MEDEKEQTEETKEPTEETKEPTEETKEPTEQQTEEPTRDFGAEIDALVSRVNELADSIAEMAAMRLDGDIAAEDGDEEDEYPDLSSLLGGF